MTELPEDVLSIIRDYSKPVFVWFKEYNESRRLDLIANHMEKLKEKIGEPTIREQLKICVDACADHKQSYETFLQENSRLNEEEESQKDWWNSVNLDKLCAMLDDREYHMMNYAYWYFKDEMDDAWMDSDDEGWHDEACQAEAWRQQEEWMNEEALREQDEWMNEQALE